MGLGQAAQKIEPAMSSVSVQVCEVSAFWLVQSGLDFAFSSIFSEPLIDSPSHLHLQELRESSLCSLVRILSLLAPGKSSLQLQACGQAEID